MDEVRILGPVDVVVDGRPVSIGSAQLRRLLAALAVSVDEVVSVDRLIDILWGDAAPLHAPSTLAKSVYRLRSALGDTRGAAQLLVTQPPGYALRLDGQVDANRFTGLVTDARTCLTGAELADAGRLLDDALALWRGPALAEFAHEEFAQAEAARLEGLRAAALEERGDVELALGHHVELIDELHGTIVDFPLRERPRGQLMLALHRSGRQAEALRAYADFRQVLIDEVGLEPSPDLQQLDQAIARRSAELDWVPAGPVSSRPPGSVRRELPRGAVTFMFTDIEHSTQLLRRLGPAYATALDRHRRLIRDAVAAHGGADVNAEGDGMLFAFEGGADAMSACVAAQRALLAEAWPEGIALRVRMGLHTGEAVPADGDYVALSVHQAARVVECAYGSQIIASQATVGVASDALPSLVSLRSLGRLPLRDFDASVELFQICHPELPVQFPPPRHAPDSEVRAPLPPALVADRAALVGRSADLEWLDTLWSRVRGGESCAALLFGPHGAGKSRLAAEFSRRVHAFGAVVVQPEGLEGVDALLATAPGSTPLVIVLDDLPSPEQVPPSQLVRAVTQRSDIARLIIAIFTDHFDEESHLRATVEEHALVATRELAGLEASDVAALLAKGGEPPPAELVEAVLAETAGLPALVVEMSRQLHERQAARRVERALQRADTARAELQSAEDDIAGGVLEHGRAGASPASRAAHGTCPYKGLARFDVADADYYFGRDRLVAALIASLATTGFVGVVGPSGSGKSSVVRAGLVSALAGGCLPGSSQWPVVILRPGADPLGRLAADVGGLDLDGAAREAVRGLAAGARLVVVVDQFEELFTVCRDDDARRQFIDALVSVDEQESPAAIVMTVRADYYGACAAYPALARLLEQHQVLVGAMTAPELRDVIVEPGRRTGLAVEPGLVDAITSDVADQPGMLPLVSTALLETWARRTGDTMTVAAYDDAGGVRAAVARLADRTYDSLPPTDQATARRIFLRLAEIGEGKDDVSRRAPRRELVDDQAGNKVLDVLIANRLLTADGETVEVAHEALLREWPKLRSWLERDRDGRRLHRQLTEAAAQWDADGRDPSALYRGARLAGATEWATAHLDDPNPLERAFLDASAALDQQELRAARHTSRRLRALAVGLSILLVVALVAGGLALAQRRNADRQANRALTEARHSLANRLATLARSLGSGQTDLALLLGLEGHQLDPSVETEGGLEGALVHVPPGIEQVIQTGAPMNNAVVSYDGRRLLAPKIDGSVQMRDLVTGQVLRSFTGSAAPAVAGLFDISLDLVVVGHYDGDVEVFEAATGTRIGSPFHMGPEAAFGWFATPDGSRLFTISAVPGTESTKWQAVLWDRHDPDHPHTVGEPFVFPVPTGATPFPSVSRDSAHFIGGNSRSGPTPQWDIALHQPLASLPISSPSGWPFPDGVTVAGVDGDHVALVDTRTGLLEGEPFPSLSSGPPGIIVVSTDGRQLATTDAVRGGTIVVFDVATRTQIGSVTLPTGAQPTAFLPDGRLAITSGSQELIWRPGITEPPIGVSLGVPVGPAAGTWSTDGHTIVAMHSEYYTNVDHPMFAFDGLTGAPRGQFLDDRASYNEVTDIAVALNPDATVAAVAAHDRVVHLWDRASGEELAVLDGHRGGELGVVWSSVGDRVATIGPDQTALLWDVSDVHHPRLAGPPLVLPGEPAPNPPSLIPQFSEDGLSLLVIDEPHGKLVMFDVATGAQKWTVDEGLFPLPTRFRATGELVLTSGALVGVETGRSLVVLDAETGQPRRAIPLTGVGFGVDFLRGGSLLVVAGAATNPEGGRAISVVRLYDAATGAPLGEPLPVGVSPADPGEKFRYYQTTGFALSSPDGSRFISGTSGPSQSVVLWDVDLNHWEATACRIAGRNLTLGEWNQYLPGQPYHVTCPQWPTH